MESFRPCYELTCNDTNNLADILMKSVSTEWTNEKHSLYLDTMEASFVSQLYSSMDMLASNAQTSTKTQLDNYSTDEFKVLHNRCCETINYPRVEPQVNRTDEATSIRRNPWIQHYKSAEKSQVVTPLIVQGSSKPRCETTSMSKPSQVCRSHLCNQDMYGSNDEVSGQNFPDENFVEEKASGFHTLKRLKTCG